jgi:hypothetical protein
MLQAVHGTLCLALLDFRRHNTHVNINLSLVRIQKRIHDDDDDDDDDDEEKAACAFEAGWRAYEGRELKFFVVFQSVREEREGCGLFVTDDDGLAVASSSLKPFSTVWKDFRPT